VPQGGKGVGPGSLPGPRAARRACWHDRTLRTPCRIVNNLCIGPIYSGTPAGHGYASAATAAVSQQARGAGAEEVLLYTHLANPVSNSICQRIGYRPVEDRVVLAFSGG
jgi:hypothetical protein